MLDLHEGILLEFAERAGNFEVQVGELIRDGALNTITETTMAEQMSERRHARKMSGLCRECGAKSARYRCEGCAVTHLNRTRASRESQKAAA